MVISKLVRAKFRVKIKSLAEESRIIRREEKRCVGPKHDSTRGHLWWHRVSDVRKEQRSTFLALAFLRGVQYRVVESPNSKLVDTKAVLRILQSLALKTKMSEQLDLWLKVPKQAAA